MHVSNYFYNEPNIRLADELCRRTGFDRAFFCNSGTEANEALLKLARHHFYGLGQKERAARRRVPQRVPRPHAGRALDDGTPKYREGFGPLGPVTHVPYGDADAVERAMGPDVCAIIVEPVQGEGGVLPAPAGLPREAAGDRDAHGALLLVDEVQTGIGRLGRFLGERGHGRAARRHRRSRRASAAAFRSARCSPPRSSRARCRPGTPRLDVRREPARVRRGARGAADPRRGEARRRRADQGRSARRDARGSSSRELPDVCEGARGEGLLRGLVLRPGFVARDVLPRIQEAGVLLTAAGERVLRFSPPLVVIDGRARRGRARGATRARELRPQGAGLNGPSAQRGIP